MPQYFLENAIFTNSGDLILNKTVLGIWFRSRILMFLGLPYPDPLVRGMDPDPSLFL
jgi:hypothetical protein